MKKINLVPYKIKGMIKQEDGSTEEGERDYDVKGSIAGMLFNPALKLDGRALLKNGKLAEKIEACKEDYILLELADYNDIKKALEVIQGLSKNDILFVKRILEEVEDVEVEEKKKK